MATILSQGAHATADRLVSVAVFGKHPGWDDHIEDIGIDTERLIQLRQVLYVQGVGGNIDSGAWERADKGAPLGAFHHVLCWHHPEDVIFGRLWSSKDGKGRARYPMVVCVQCSGVAAPWVLREVPSRLERVEQRCKQAGTAAEVKAIVSELRGALSAAIRGADSVGPPEGWPSPQDVMGHLASCPGMGPGHDGLHRVLYRILREMHAYGPGTGRPGRGEPRRPQCLRVPSCAPTAPQAVYTWLHVMLSQLDPSVPVLLLAPLEQAWVDVVVGDPGVREFFCLQASQQMVPLATEIPYSMDADFVQRAERLIAGSGGATGAQASIIGPAAESAKPGLVGGWMHRMANAVKGSHDRST